MFQQPWWFRQIKQILTVFSWLCAVPIFLYIIGNLTIGEQLKPVEIGNRYGLLTFHHTKRS